MPLVPELYVKDIQQSLVFYVGVLGFQIDWQRPEENFATISLEDCRLMLEEYSSPEKSSEQEIKQGHWRTADFEYPLGRGINFEITLSDIEPLYAKLKQANYPIKLDLYETQYCVYKGSVNEKMLSVQQFLVMDPDGYLLRFAQELEQTS